MTALIEDALRETLGGRRERSSRSRFKLRTVGDQAYALSDLVLGGFVRVVTHPHCRPGQPGPRHWVIFDRLCRKASARGNLVPDAYLAALAIEAGCEWITTDRNFARVEGLRWRHQLR